MSEHQSENVRLVYLAPDASWYALLDTPMGVVPPPSIPVAIPWVYRPREVRLLYCGTPSDVFADLNSRYKQAELGEALGLSQQQISRIVNGVAPANLAADQWLSLARLYRDSSDATVVREAIDAKRRTNTERQEA